MDGATLPPGIRLVTRSAFVERDSVSEVLQILAMTATSSSSPAIAMRSVSGAVSRVANDATAYSHRRAELMLATLTAGPDAVVTAAEPKLEAIWEALAPHVAGAYANFLSSATEADVAAIYSPETFRRLAAIKRQYDPGDVFARNHNVAPSPSRLNDARKSQAASGKAGSSAPRRAATRSERVPQQRGHHARQSGPRHDAHQASGGWRHIHRSTSSQSSKGAPHADSTANEDTHRHVETPQPTTTPPGALSHRGDGGRAGAHHRRDHRPVRHQRTARPHPGWLSRLHRPRVSTPPSTPG